MIASQHITRSFGPALNYNLRKLLLPDANQRAELLDTNFSQVDRAGILKEVQVLRSLRPELSRYTYHTSLNFPVEDAGVLDSDKLLSIAQDYLAGMGYDRHPYLIFRHHDAGHPHIHLLACRIGFDGSVVPDSNNYQRSEALVRRLEERYRLTKVQGSRQAQRRAPTKNELEKGSRTKRPSGKLVLQELLSSLLTTNQSHSKPTLTALISRGERLGIGFLFNRSATTGHISGVTYLLEDFKCTGKALGRQFGWKQLITQIDYEQNRDEPAVSAANGRAQNRNGLSSAAGTNLRQAAAIAANGRTGTAGKGAAHHRAAGSGDDPRTLRGSSPHAGQRHPDRELPAQGGHDDAGPGQRTGAAADAEPAVAAGAGQTGTDKAHYPDAASPIVHPAGTIPRVDIADDEDDALRRRRRGRSR